MGFGALLGGAMAAGNFVSDLFNQGYNRRMQREAWDREDNAVQRRSADMAAAGINPIMAAGSPAQSSNAAHTAPVEASMDAILAGADLEQKKEDLYYTREQRNLLKEQILTAKVDRELSLKNDARQDAESVRQDVRLNKDMKHLDAQIRLNGIDYVLRQQQVELAREGLKQEQIKTIMIGVEKEFQKKGIIWDLRNKEMQAKLQRLLLQKDSRDFQYWKDQGLFGHPSGQGSFNRELSDLFAELAASLFGYGK